MLGSKAFWAYASNVALTVAMFLFTLVAIPLVGEAEFGWSKTQIGVAHPPFRLGISWEIPSPAQSRST